VGSIVGEFMEEKKKEQAEEKARQVPRRRNPALIPLLVLLVGGLFASPLLAPQPAELSQDTVEQGARMSLYLASLRVRAYERTHRQLPTSLTQAGINESSIEYTRPSPTTFELSTQVLGSKMVYRSTLPDSLFLGPNLRIRGIS
jgi:hypothetical protein